MRRAPPIWSRAVLAAVVLALHIGCPVIDICDNALHDALLDIHEQWPTYGAAKASTSPYWVEAHSLGELEGVGLTLVAMQEPPSWDNPLPDIRESNGDLLRPSLLFFDVREDEGCWFSVDEDAPLIGVGYHEHFEPCDKPVYTDMPDEAWYVHEAGYHHVPAGDGRFVTAANTDLIAPAVLDDEGCVEVHDEDLFPRVGQVGHGRAWTSHLWFHEREDACPVASLSDPFARQSEDALAVPGDAFFLQGDCGCPAPSDAGVVGDAGSVDADVTPDAGVARDGGPPADINR